MLSGNMYGMYPNIYNNQIAMNDLSGLDLYCPMGTMDPMMSMNGSVFGCSPMMNPMMANPMMMGGGNYQDYYRNYEQYQDFMIDSQVRQQQKMRNADLQLNSPQEGIQKQAAILHEKILQGEQQQIKYAYNSFKESVRAMYGDNATEEQIANRASTVYGQITGRTLVDDIRANGHDSFTHGVLQSATFGLYDRKTSEENIADLTGQPVGNKERVKKIAGNVVGGAAVGGAAALGLSTIWKFKGPFFKTLFKFPVLAAIGGLVAGALTLARQ